MCTCLWICIHFGGVIPIHAHKNTVNGLWSGIKIKGYTLGNIQKRSVFAFEIIWFYVKCVPSPKETKKTKGEGNVRPGVDLYKFECYMKNHKNSSFTFHLAYKCVYRAKKKRKRKKKAILVCDSIPYRFIFSPDTEQKSSENIPYMFPNMVNGMNNFQSCYLFTDVNDFLCIAFGLHKILFIFSSSPFLSIRNVY